MIAFDAKGFPMTITSINASQCAPSCIHLELQTVATMYRSHGVPPMTASPKVISELQNVYPFH